MGIPQGKYDVQLIRRTKDLINSYKGKYNLTLLMNSLLSLIVLPKEYNARIKALSFMNQDLTQIQEVQGILNSINFRFDRRKYGYDLKNLLGRIRNGIAHQRIEAVSNPIKNTWDSVIIEDYNLDGTLGLHLEISLEELKLFALYIANEYLKEVDPKTTPVS